MIEIDKSWTSAGYPHIRIPKRLLTAEYSDVSPEAKLIYGAMMDRTSLSHRNRSTFTNDRNEIYIYFPQSEIMEILGCGHDKAGKVLKELVGAKLLKVRRRGIGRAYEIVLFPMDWRVPRKNGNEQSEKPQPNNEKPENLLSGNSARNNTDGSNSDTNNPDYYLSRFVKSAIKYDELVAENDSAVVNRILEVMVHTIGAESAFFLIHDQAIEAEIIKDELRFMKKGNVQFVIKKLKNSAYIGDHTDVYILNALMESTEHQ